MSDRYGEFKRCKTCGKHDFEKTHRCPPSWECQIEATGEDWWNTMYAVDSEQAAEKFAEIYDCEGGEYAIVGGKHRDTVIIKVRKHEGAEVERFAIEAEVVPTYRATLLSQE